MQVLKRALLTATTIGAAGGLLLSGAAPASAATVSGVRYGLKAIAVAEDGNSGATCTTDVLSAALSTGKPAYASIIVFGGTAGPGCSGWVQSSTDNGLEWVTVSPVQTTSGAQNGWYKSANYYAGPGTEIRGCVDVSGTIACTAGVTLAASSGKPASDAIGGYLQYQADIVRKGHGECAATVSSSTAAKAAGSRASLLLVLLGSLPCSGWLEAYNAKTKKWTQATPTYSVASGAFLVYAFSGGVADGTGHLVRACVKNTTTSCSASW